VKRSALLGLDIGGSKSRARLVEGDRILADVTGPGANVAVLAPRLIERRIGALIAQLGPIPPVACCAGSAGAEAPAGKARLERLLASLLPGSVVTVVHDARLVLAAAGFDAGIALIAGTGSVAYGRSRDGREARAGGWGWMLGDEGSAVWLTREAAREVMWRSDAAQPAGDLGDRLMKAMRSGSAAELSGKLHRLREPSRWAEVAAIVFEAAGRDAGAAALVDRAGSALGSLVETVRTDLAIDGPLVLAGGLLLNQPALESAVRKCVGDAVRLEEPPVAGAVRLARARLGRSDE